MTVEFTSKERDAETGLDYFGARYMSSAQGRFSSPDPLGMNILRVLNPQRWNMYAYAVNNPLAYTDPDGRDAIAVTFSKLAVGAGHSAVISVHRDGTATYADYAPRGGAKPVGPGEYSVVDLKTKLMFGADGIPTTQSFASLASELSGTHDQPVETLSMAYFKTSDAETAALDAYLAQTRRFAASGNFSLYVVGVNDCISFCNTALGKANIGRGSEIGDVPIFMRSIFDYLGNASYSGRDGTVKKNKNKESKPDVHSTFTPCGTDNPDCADSR
jgi:RHS repeat-associated protein